MTWTVRRLGHRLLFGDIGYVALQTSLYTWFTIIYKKSLQAAPLTVALPCTKVARALLKNNRLKLAPEFSQLVDSELNIEKRHCTRAHCASAGSDGSHSCKPSSYHMNHCQILRAGTERRRGWLALSCIQIQTHRWDSLRPWMAGSVAAKSKTNILQSSGLSIRSGWACSQR